MNRFKRSINLVWTYLFMGLLLEALDPGVGGTGDALLDGAYVALYTNSLTPGPGAVAGDFVLATIGGVAHEQDLDNLSDVINLPSERRGIHQEVNWIAADTDNPQTAIGYVVFNADDEVIAAERFAQPVGFDFVGDNLSLDVVFALKAQMTTGLAA